MAKKPGSKSSRSERRAGRKRAERAHEHGLPVRRELPARARARASTPDPARRPDGQARSSAAPLAGAVKPAGVPTLVKVLGGALVILAGVYLLGRHRDEALTEARPSAEVAASAPAPRVEPAPPPSFAPAPAAVASTAPPPSVTIAPSSHPAPARVASPTKPPAVAPVMPAPAASVTAPVPSPKRVATPAPADNPY